MLDASLYLAGVAVWLKENHSLALPKSLDCLRLGRLAKAGEKCLLRLIPRESIQTEKIFDIVCYGEDRSVLFAIDGYHCQIVKNSSVQPDVTTSTG